MKKGIVPIILLFVTSFSVAGEQYCEKERKRDSGISSIFQHRFCFGSADFMKTFAIKLYDQGVPFAVYGDGDIAYKEEDKERIQTIGDKLVQKYLSQKGGK
jgi:hypothetical protein